MGRQWVHVDGFCLLALWDGQPRARPALLVRQLLRGLIPLSVSGWVLRPLLVLADFGRVRTNPPATASPSRKRREPEFRFWIALSRN